MVYCDKPALSPLRSSGRVATRDAVELETRRLEPKSIEKESATDRTSLLRFSSVITQPEDSLVQVEQTHPKEKKQNKKKTKKEQNPHEDQDQLLAEMSLRNVNEIYPRQARRTRKGFTTLICYTMLLTGALSLVISIVTSSSILAFIGLGVLFWGALLLFIRPQQYVRSDLMDSTALSSLKTIDRVMWSLGYLEKGVYVPTGNPEKAIMFIPAEPFSRIPKASEIADQTFIKSPKGLAMIPPGLSLANLIERELGVPLTKCTLQDLRDRLPKLLIEDLEIVQDFQMHIHGDYVRFRFVDSIYSDFCKQLRSATKVSCSMGCPICSAMACVLAATTGKPVSFEEDKYYPDVRVLESSYRMLEA